MRLLDDYERSCGYTYLSFHGAKAPQQPAVAAALADDSRQRARAVILILIVTAALPCRAERNQRPVEGTARVPDDELTVVVDLAQENGRGRIALSFLARRERHAAYGHQVDIARYKLP